MGSPRKVASTSRTMPIASAILGAGCSNGTEKRRSFTHFTYEPRPRTNRPPNSSARSRAAIAVIVGLRGKARAMSVPTVVRDVAAATTAAWTYAERAVSATHRLSNPASSARRASAPRAARSPPRTSPRSTDSASPSGGRSVRRRRRRGPQPSGHHFEQLQRDRRVLFHEPLEHPGRQAQQANRGLRHHGRRPRPAVQERDLAEHVPGPHLRPAPAVDHDLRRALDDQEEPDPAVAFRRQDVARRARDLLDRSGDRPQLLLRASGEQANAGEPLDDLGLGHVRAPPLARRVGLYPSPTRRASGDPGSPGASGRAPPIRALTASEQTRRVRHYCPRS